MSFKIFLFNKKELSQIGNPETKAIGLSDKTWEEATRFMLQKKFSCLSMKLDAKRNLIGYEVSWLEKGEYGNIKRNLPPDVFYAFQSMEFGDEFISLFIETARQQIRLTVK